MRTGTILTAAPYPAARKPAFRLTIDFGETIGVKKSSAQITVHYSIEELINKKVIAVVNFPPKQIGSFFSECLVLGIYDENNDVILLSPDKDIPNGQRIG